MSRLDVGADMLTIVTADTFADEVTQTVKMLGTLATSADMGLDTEAIAAGLVEALRDSGALSLTGYGRSVLREADGVFVQKTFWRGGKGARFWNLVATDAPAPDDFLPADAVLASSSSADPQALWDMIQTLARSYPGASEQLDELVQTLRSSVGLDIPALVSTLRPGVFAAVMFDPSRTIPLPDEEDISIPAPGLLLGLRADTDAMYDRLSFFLPMAGLMPETETLGDNAVGVRFRLPDDDIPVDLLQPTVRYLRARKVLLVASTPAIADAAMAAADGTGRLIDTPDFRNLSKGLPSEGGIGWVSPVFGKTLRSLLETAVDETPELVPLRSSLEKVERFWLVSRTIRSDDGIFSVARTSATTPASSRILAEVFGGYTGIAALGVVGGTLFPAVSGATESANSTKIANQGRNIAVGLMSEIMMREANNDGSIWPGDAYTLYDGDGNAAKEVAAGSYSTSSEYFDDLIRYGAIETITGYGLFSGAGVPMPGEDETLSSDEDCNIWSCISVDAGSVSGDLPLLFTRNLKLTNDDLRRLLRPGETVSSDESWASKLDPSEKPFGSSRVVIVTRGGAVMQVRARDLTARLFFGDAKFSHPEAVRVLPAH